MTDTPVEENPVAPACAFPSMPAEICKALIEFKLKGIKLVKDKTAKVAGKAKSGGKAYSYSFQYQSFGAMLDDISGPLAECGLGFYHDFGPVTRSGRGDFWTFTIKVCLFHASGAQHCFAPQTWSVMGNTKEDIAKVKTYARRYVLKDALGLAPVEEEGEPDKRPQMFDGPGQARQRGQQQSGSRQQPPNNRKRQEPKPPKENPGDKPYPWDKSMTVGGAKARRKATLELAQRIGHDVESLQAAVAEFAGKEDAMYLGDLKGPENGGAPGFTSTQMNEFDRMLEAREGLLSMHKDMGLPGEDEFHQWLADELGSDAFLHTIDDDQLAKAAGIAAEVIEDVGPQPSEDEEAEEEEGAEDE